MASNDAYLPTCFTMFFMSRFAAIRSSGFLLRSSRDSNWHWRHANTTDQHLIKCFNEQYKSQLL